MVGAICQKKLTKSLQKTDLKTQPKFIPFYGTACYKTKRDCCKTQDRFICSQAQITVAKTRHCFASFSNIGWCMKITLTLQM